MNKERLATQQHKEQSPVAIQTQQSFKDYQLLNGNTCTHTYIQ